MLSQLEIQNVALIDRVSIELGNGLNIITGETGAGKSIMIDSIHALLGERLSRDLIRTGREKALVEAVFQVDNERFAGILDELGIDAEEDGTLIISREFSISGKNICRINGKMVTVSALKELGERLIDIHGQHDNQSLLRVDSHIRLLDAFGGSRLMTLLEQYVLQHSRFRDTKTRLKSLTGDRNDREKRMELLKYQIDEIKKSKLGNHEEEELEKQKLKAGSAERIAGALASVYELLYSGSNVRKSASDSIAKAVSEINGISRLDEKYENIGKKLEELSYQLDDVIDEVRRQKDDVEFDPAQLEKIEERLDLIFKLKRKYGGSIAEIKQFCKKAEEELEAIERSDELVQELKLQLERENQELFKLASGLHAAREEAAALLESRICTVLGDLEMKNARFKVDIQWDTRTDEGWERKYLQDGLDRVEFLISANPGEPLKPLSKIASGGEMSRVMLAVKSILADVDEIPTLIFDEIDIGISGKASQKVGEKLSYISRNHQVLCITHHAQIAGMADCHYLIEKVTEDDSTHTSVEKLDDKGRQKEIARMLGGASITDITRKHAEEILKNSRLLKMKKEA